MADTPSLTLNTVSDYLDDARTLLQDAVSPFRYDDPSLLVAFNVTMLEARRLRPDLFVYRYHGSVPHFTANNSEIVHMEPPFRLALLYGLVAHALMRDQEDIVDARASAFMAGFNSMLIGLGSSTIVVPPGRAAPPTGAQGG